MRKKVEDFLPPWGLRSRHTQSLLSSSPIRRRLVWRRSTALRAVQQTVLLDGGDGVRLQGYLSRQSVAASRGLVVLLHGWEGSVNSNYILSNGARLYAAGFDVFRLNFRDHGDTHHLNPGMFHSNRLGEVVNSLADLQAKLQASSQLGDWTLAGYSLGGNFALRVALQAGAAGLALRQVISICPVIDPARALLAMESGHWFYQRYFERKWSRSLAIKRKCFPELYGHDDFTQLRSLRERTHYLATQYAGFKDSESYYDGYSIAGDRLAGMQVPCTILTAEDDPVVPVDDFRGLPEIPQLEILVSAYGGHCGFLKNWKLESMAEDLIHNQVEKQTTKSAAIPQATSTNQARTAAADPR
ncbi:MAG TPA: alpha/beta fold hydrolase [Xanthomonadales bacterium]|nr:alpha/beta fold hydrolase [Xanthomonadales bacterium]